MLSFLLEFALYNLELLVLASLNIFGMQVIIINRNGLQLQLHHKTQYVPRLDRKSQHLLPINPSRSAGSRTVSTENGRSQTNYMSLICLAL
jgi:hypothetical protein